LIKLFYIPIYAYRLSKSIKKDDLVISFLVRSNLVNVISSIFKKHNVILSERNTPSMVYANGIKNYIMKRLIKIFYKRADKIIVNSYGIKYDLIHNFNIESSKINVINNALDIDKIKEKLLVTENIDKELLQYFEDNKVIITIGSFSVQKFRNLYIDFDFWFALKLRQFESKLSEIKNFLNFQLEANFNNSIIELAEFLKISIRQYQSKFLKKRVVETLKDWIENKLKLCTEPKA